MLRPINLQSGGSPQSSSPTAEQEDAPAAQPGPSQPQTDDFAIALSNVRSALTTSQHRRRRHSGSESEGSAARRSRLSPQDPINTAKQELLMHCQEKGIIVLDTLHALIDDCPDDKKLSLIEKIQVYFTSVDRSATYNTSALTSMIYLKKEGSTRPLIAAFLSIPDEEVRQVASAPHQRSLAAMYNNRGLPRIEDINTFLAIPALKIDGSINSIVLRSISSMFHGSGFPSEAEVEAIVNHEDLRSNDRLEIELLQTIASLNHGKGIPEHGAVKALLTLEELQVNGRPDRKLLSTIASMVGGKGMPDLDQVRTLLIKTREYGLGNYEEQLELLRCFSALYRNKGLPSVTDTTRLFLLPGLQINGQFSRELFRQVATSHSHQRFPTATVIAEARKQFLSTGQHQAALPGASVGQSQEPTLRSLLLSPRQQLFRRQEQAPTTSAQASSGLHSRPFATDEQPSTSAHQAPLLTPATATTDQLSTEEMFTWAEEVMVADGFSPLSAQLSTASVGQGVSTATVTLSPEESDELDLIAEFIAEDSAAP